MNNVPRNILLNSNIDNSRITISSKLITSKISTVTMPPAFNIMEALSNDLDNKKKKYIIKNEYSNLTLEPDKITSSLLNAEVLTLLQTIKEVLIENNFISLEEFENKYVKVHKDLQNKIEQQKVANKLENK